MRFQTMGGHILIMKTPPGIVNNKASAAEQKTVVTDAKLC